MSMMGVMPPAPQEERDSMTKAFEELEKILKEKGKVTLDDIEEVTKKHGDLTKEEKTKLLESASQKEEKDKRSKTFEALRKIVEDKGKFTPEDMEKAVKEHGPLSDQEKADIAALQLEAEKRQKKEEKAVTFEEFLEATKALESAKEGSEEWKKAKAIVDRFEAGE
jgi:hypothetical protein